ncbi:hypothetical protein H8B02_20895 [Bradyrhizobium sp. Pear77]|uniref:hypothetical protein n=1 Tax=Bradyrhizobium altum TaxID=1571202 RepID=UPI001E58D80C|nr:hypothetical protein [Bradyrhizobium altum]MCC8955797.1 hypothetical protein [Bradyrhizobium altum]
MIAMLILERDAKRYILHQRMIDDRDGAQAAAKHSFRRARSAPESAGRTKWQAHRAKRYLFNPS